MGAGLDTWDTSSMTTMSYAFNGASVFNQYIGSWNTSLVTTMLSMFNAASAFNQDIGSWNTSLVQNMSSMFQGAIAFNQDISTKTINAGQPNEYVAWDVSSVTTMSSMFIDAPFNQDIGNWDVSSVTDMYEMFRRCLPFNQDISSWDTSSVTNMSLMFDNCYNFNQDISVWDTSSVTTMALMFRSANKFDQNLGSWNISSLTTASAMFTNSGLTTPNYDALLIGWAAQEPNIQSGVTLSDIPCQYSSAAAAAHDLLTGTYSWSISDLGPAVAQTVFTVDTKNTATGSSAADQYAITFGTGGLIDATVYWGDGTNNKITSISDPNLTHTYPSQGIYQIAIEATDPSVTRTTNLVFGSLTTSVAGDCLKVTSIDDWGDCTYSSAVNDYWIAFTQALTSVPATGPVNFALKRGTFYGSAITNPRLTGYSSVQIVSGTWLFRDSDIVEGLNGSLTFPNNQNLLGAFQGASSFIEDLDNWDVSSLNGMTSCFSGASSFNGNIDNWDVSNFTAMNGAFSSATAFNRDLSAWDVSSVISFIQTFSNASSFNNAGIGGVGAGLDTWSINSTIGAGVSMYQMFFNAVNFNQYIGSWPMSQVDDVRSMFQNAINFNNGDASGFSGGGSGVAMDRWDISSITELTSMFSGASSFNQYIGNWNTVNITSMTNMFQNASSFDQPLGNWDISNLLDAANMFTNSGLSRGNYDDLLIGWAANPAAKPNVTLSVIPVNFTPGGAAESAYNYLTGSGGWTIIDPNHP
jgi:surface protein